MPKVGEKKGSKSKSKAKAGANGKPAATRKPRTKKSPVAETLPVDGRQVIYEEPGMVKFVPPDNLLPS